MSEGHPDDALRAIDDSMLTECQGKLEVVQAQNENLKTALQSARRIGAAIGILMNTRKITVDAAFDLLCKVSQNSHTKLREVADEVVMTGTLPTQST